MMGKKIIRWLMAAVCVVGMNVGFTACSSDGGDENSSFSEKSVENYVVGYKWYLDGNTHSEFRFYRNRLVTRVSDTRITSGMLTYETPCFMGTWQVVDGKLITTFTSGTHGGFDWNNILFGSLTITELRTNFKKIVVTAPNGDSHELSSYMKSYGSNNEFVDYTDASDHDGALVGTWMATGYKNDQPIDFKMTINKSGKVRFTAPSENIDFTTTCTTKNGHVTFDHFLAPTVGSYSFIYIREKETIKLYSEKNALQIWAWRK